MGLLRLPDTPMISNLWIVDDVEPIFPPVLRCRESLEWAKKFLPVKCLDCTPETIIEMQGKFDKAAILMEKAYWGIFQTKNAK